MAAALVLKENGVLAEQENLGHPQASLGAGWRAEEPQIARVLPPKPRCQGQTARWGYPGCQLAHKSWGALGPTASVPSVLPTRPVAQVLDIVGPTPPAPGAYGPLAISFLLAPGSTQPTLRVRLCEGFQTLRDNDASSPTGPTTWRVTFQRLPRSGAHSTLGRVASPGDHGDPHAADDRAGS